MRSGVAWARCYRAQAKLLGELCAVLAYGANVAIKLLEQRLAYRVYLFYDGVVPHGVSLRVGGLVRRLHRIG
jgi:hypothetical protein